VKNDYLDYVEEGDFSKGHDSWDEHRKTQRLISKNPQEEDFDLTEWLKWYLVYKKMSAIDSRHSNKIDSPTVKQAKNGYKKSSRETVTEGYVRQVLNRMVERPFFTKNEIDEQIRNVFYVGDNTSYCYEYITLKERGQELGRRKRLHDLMKEDDA